MTVAGTSTLLSVRDLAIHVRSRRGFTPVVRNVSFDVAPGEAVGLVGESGCGKSLTVQSVVSVLPTAARVETGVIEFEGHDLLTMPRRELDRVRGRRIGMIFQDARRSLNPAFTVGEQIAEIKRRHLGLSRAEARRAAVEALDEVGITRAARRVGDYPHMFSGGMAQRVMIACALACRPSLLIADEPTTGLDVTVQAQVLRLLWRLRSEHDLSIVFITHDLPIISEMCDRVNVMYAGQIVESGTTSATFHAPQHPYTSALLASTPRPEVVAAGRLETIAGVIPAPADWPVGCSFQPRCPHAADDPCSSPQTLTEFGDRRVRCGRREELELAGVGRKLDDTAHC